MSISITNQGIFHQMESSNISAYRDFNIEELRKRLLTIDKSRNSYIDQVEKYSNLMINSIYKNKFISTKKNRIVMLEKLIIKI